MSSKSNILFIMHMPPPVHGAAMMGKYIHDSKLINSTFDCHYINLTIAKSLQDQEQQLLRLLPLAVQQDDYWLPAEISQVFPRQFRRGVF